ncbi:hypothetical protein A3A05_03340 [Candidatus Nomurabacteria bacterium RIFCSPLOWO2_01_FULL_41_12]|uniref:Thiol-disulfide oxidoreductase n=1 Tax=Candidatus Nomurabacteria bacterium RIFCSPLOWO2_01_FULL_41_12 TaxID=1801774 RepID=A0A1F6WVM4_9BACT|nr:MAG: hypothetical protein A2732_02390 [Candidatus Nomurabacteria bacterium RIFCSPHIGHO2_01_FULL_40_10]OGI85805.1 MAG: hypothetical protein A3A05_03340 [Candidatus Nomurabacteria bacterium RIFCSPLOWO2_01_FULL_41_12]
MINVSYPITVFYDGTCRMCIAQISKFQKADSKKRLIFIDASKPNFNQEKAGLMGESIERYIYAKDPVGHLVRGIDAFIWMWTATDRKFLAWFINLPLIKQLGKLIYRLISRSRYLFGGKKDICDFHCKKEI